MYFLAEAQLTGLPDQQESASVPEPSIRLKQDSYRSPIWRRAISTCQTCGRIFRIYVKNAVEKAIVVSGQFFNIMSACRLS